MAVHQVIREKVSDVSTSKDNTRTVPSFNRVIGPTTIVVYPVKKTLCTTKSDQECVQSRPSWLMQSWFLKKSVSAPYLRPKHQSVHALVVALANVRSSRYENPNNLFVPFLCCTHQRCCPLLVRFVHKRVGFDEKFNDFGVPCAMKITTGDPYSTRVGG